MTVKLWEPKRKCPKVVPTHLQTHVVWCEAISDRALNHMLFQWISSPEGPHTWSKENKPTIVSVHSAMVSRFCDKPTSERWFLKMVQVTTKHDHWMPCRHPRRLYIHLASTYSVCPSSILGSELGPAPPFPPMRVLEVQMVMGSQSHMWSGPMYTGFEVISVQCFTRLFRGTGIGILIGITKLIRVDIMQYY
jgi:hypothetical protein